MIKCIIIEDEPLALERIEQFALKCPELELLACFINADKGLSYLKVNEVNVCFIDIEMNEMSGIEIIQATHYKTQFVISTAFSEYAVKGFDLNVVDYLLKPYSFERFRESITKIQSAVSKKTPKTITVPEGRNKIVLPVHEILFIEGMGDYRRIHAEDKKVMTLLTFGEIEIMLGTSDLIRIHKSHMINLKKVDKIAQNNFVWINGLSFKISDSYKTHFQRKSKFLI